MKRRISTLALAVLFAAASITASYAGQAEKYLDDPTGISPVKTQDSFQARTWDGDSDDPAGIYPAGFDPTGISPVKTQDSFQGRTWAGDSDDPTDSSPVKTGESREKRGAFRYPDDPTGISPIRS